MLITLREKRVQRYIRAVKRQTRASRQPRVNFPRKISTENIRNDRCHANSRQKKLSKFVKGNIRRKNRDFSNKKLIKLRVI